MDSKVEESLTEEKPIVENEPVISETSEKTNLENETSTENTLDGNKPDTEQNNPSEETGGIDNNLMSQESDVLELDYGVDGVEDQLGKEEPTEKVPDETKIPDDLKDCRLLWISGVDQTVKANDFRVAFEPYGKGNLYITLVAYYVFTYFHLHTDYITNFSREW